MAGTRLSIGALRVTRPALNAELERGIDRQALARFGDKVRACTPGKIVDEELEHDGSRRIFDGGGPQAVVHAVHGDAMIPTHARAFAADEKMIAEADVDLGINDRSWQFLAGDGLFLDRTLRLFDR